MKKLLIFLVLTLSVGQAIVAQIDKSTAPQSSSANDQEIRKVTGELTEKYDLSADQAKQMYTIQQRKAKNMAEIAAYQSSNPALYRAKVQNVQKGTLFNIRRILQSKAQVDLYQKTQGEVRMLRNKKQKELTAKKASKEEIELALLSIYAE